MYEEPLNSTKKTITFYNIFCNLIIIILLLKIISTQNDLYIKGSEIRYVTNVVEKVTVSNNFGLNWSATMPSIRTNFTSSKKTNTVESVDRLGSELKSLLDDILVN